MKSKIISIALLLCLAIFANLIITTDAYARKNAHGAQGTGNYKGKRDRHENPGPQNEKKKKRNNWIPLR